MDDREERWSRWASAALAGDRRSYDRFLVEVSERVRRYARSRLSRSGHGIDEAEDIVQDVLVAIHAKRETWDPSRPIGPWVDAIIRYKTADAMRKMGRRAVAAEDIDAIADLATAHYDGDRRLDDLDRHLGALPSREQGVVAALGLEGMSAAKCAERFGMSEVDVRVAFLRGVAGIRRLVEGPQGAARGTRR
ncbi:MAG: sigma-70 family RNA polymerase sigma factor [Pseudomonadota bacterium]